MFSYKIYYDGGFLKDSLDLDNSYDTEEEAQEEAQADNGETLYVSSSFLRCVRRTQRSENFFEFFKKKSIRGN